MNQQNMEFVKIYVKARCKIVKILDKHCQNIRQFNKEHLYIIN